MIWVILCKDKPNSLNARLKIIDEHRAYLSTNPIKTLISGPLTDKEGNMIGSFFMVEASSEEEIKVFQHNDPIFKANIWDEIIISPFNKRVDNLSKN